MRRLIVPSLIILLAAPAMAEPPASPPVPAVPEVTETCGEGCTKTIRKTRSSEIGPAGETIIREEVEVIELRESGDAEIEMQVEQEVTGAEGARPMRKRVRVVQVGDGELTDEMRAEIDEMIAGIDTKDFTASGDGLFISGVDGAGPARIILRQKDGDVISGTAGNIEDTVDEDGARTIKITPEEGGETTIITIRTEKSSKNDN